MRITYRTLLQLALMMNEDQLSSDVTVEIPGENCSECYPAELRIAGENHDGGLDDGHPVIYVNIDNEGHERRDDVSQLAMDIGISTQI